MKNITDETIIDICHHAKSMRSAANKLGISFTTFKRIAKKLGCYTTNQGLKGSHKPSLTKVPLNDILSGKHPNYQTYKLKVRLYEAGIKHDKCEQCGWSIIPEGNKYSPCELHHIDGNPTNHVLSNLIILCPNCHSLTKPYRFRTRVPEKKFSE